MWNPGWDELFKKNPWGRYPPEELIRFVARNYFSVSDRSKISFLELGSGPGANIWFLAREGFDVHGIDGSSVALEQAEALIKKDGLRAELLQGDATALPYPDARFDCVLDIECIYANDLKDSRRIISEAYRVLKPGGLFFSKTFMVGTSGDGNGKLLEGEPHTYVEIYDGALHKDYGIIRFTEEKEIGELYGKFGSIEYDTLVRSDRNRRHEVKEWMITCRK